MTNPERQDRPIEELVDGDNFRKSVVARADTISSGYPLWHGWVIMDAFLAGIDYARANATEAKPPSPVLERRLNQSQSDLVERLTHAFEVQELTPAFHRIPHWYLYGQAATALEAQQREIDSLRETLRDCAAFYTEGRK